MADYESITSDVYNLLDNSVNDIFYQLQNELGIESGDIFPDEVQDLESAQYDLAVVIANILINHSNLGD